MRVVSSPASGSADAEAGALLPGDQEQQHARLLCFAAKAHHRLQAEDIDMHRGHHRHAPPADLPHYQRRIGNARSRPAMFLRRGDAVPAAARDPSGEVMRKGTVAVARQPVGIVEEVALAGDGLGDGALIVG